jgi:GntR family transcriptional regulator, galactonate operon transcriptional repressor
MSKLIPKRLAQEVAQQCFLRIVNDEHPACSILPTENEMAESFGVSRVVVHEAVQILAAKGVLDVRQGRQAIVNPQEQWDPLDTEILLGLFAAGKLGTLAHDLVQIRKILEVEAAGAAADKASEEELATLKETCQQLLNASETPAEYYPLEDRFHRCVWQGSRNLLLIHMLKSLSPVLRFAKMMASRSNLPDRDIHHAALSKAICARNAAAAREAMLLDISRFDDELRAVLESGGKNENFGSLTSS